MALRPCSVCGQRTAEKHCSLYWSWNRADRSRTAWLQRVCANCFATRIIPFWGMEYGAEILCPMCHTPSGDDMDPVFCKVYVPGQPEVSLELATCPKCAVELRNGALEGAEELPDRNPQLGGQAPKLSATEVWDSLGLRP